MRGRRIVFGSLIGAAAFACLLIYEHNFSVCGAVDAEVLPPRWKSGATRVLWDGQCPTIGDYIVPGPTDYGVYYAVYPNELPEACVREKEKGRLHVFTPGNARELTRIAGVRAEGAFVIGDQVHCSRTHGFGGLDGVSGPRGNVVRVVVSYEPPFEE